MNGYVCIWKGRRVEVYASTTLEAQRTSLPLLQKMAGRKRIKSHDISVILAEKDGERVVHSPVE